MLDYGFNNFPLTDLIGEGQAVGDGLVTGSGFRYALATGEVAKIEKRLTLTNIRTPDDFGYRGEIRITLDGEPIGNVPVYEKGRIIPQQQDQRQISTGATATRNTLAEQSGWTGALIAVFKSLLLAG